MPLGVWLSGGVDSSTILHYAAKASSSRLKTFSISFRGRSFDETPYIRRRRTQYGTDHEELDLNPEQDLQGAIEEFAYYSDEPSADAGALPVWFLSKLCKTQTTVALSGEGADEAVRRLSDLPRQSHRALHSRRCRRGCIRLALAVLRHWPVSDEKISFEYKLKRLLEGCLMAERARTSFGTAPSRTPRKAHLLRMHASRLRSMPSLPICEHRRSEGDDLAPYLGSIRSITFPTTSW